MSHLQNLFSNQLHRLSGIHVSAEHLEILVQRASQVSDWNSCGAGHLDVFQAWRSVGATLRAHRRIPAEEGPRLQRNTAIAQALADFVEHHADHANQAIDNALRHFGAHGDQDTQEARLGSAYEWPPSLSQQHTRYTALCARLDNLSEEIEDAHRDHGRDAVLTMLTSFQTALGRIRGALERAADIESEEHRSEGVAAINTRITELRHARAVYEHQHPAGEVSQQEHEAEPSADHAPSPERAHEGGEQEPVPSLDAHTERALARAECHRMEQALRSNKTHERQEHQAVRDGLHAWFGDRRTLVERCERLII